jgi:hypothetical protein
METGSNVIELDPELMETFRKLDRIELIVQWSAKMCQDGLMPPEVAKAFHEHFGDG